MITPKYLIIHDFGAFADCEYYFDGRPKSVMGDNQTDDGQESNGAGKSWAQGAIEFVNVGTNSRKETGKNLIRRGCSSGYVEMGWNCGVRNEVLIIVREQTKSGAKLKLYRNDKDHPIEMSNIKDGDDRILKWLGTNKEDFLSFFVLTQENYSSFFKSVGGNNYRLGLISRLSDMSFFDDIEANLKKDIDSKEAEIKVAHENISNMEGRLEEAELNIEELKLRGDDEDSEEDVIKKIKIRITCIESDIAGQRVDIEACKKKDTELTASLSKKEKVLKDFIKTIPDSKELNQLLSDYNDEIMSLNKDIIEAEKNLQGKVDCPKCSYEFIVGRSDVDISVEQIIIKDCQDILHEIKVDKEDIETELLGIREKEKEKRKLEREVDEIKDLIRRNKRKETSLLNQIDDDKLEIKRQKNRIESVKNEPEVDNQKLIKDAEKKAEGYKNELVELRGKLSKLEEEELFNLNYWKNNFKRFKMYLANDTIEYIQRACNNHLNKMGSDLLVKIDGFKIKADGSLKEEVTPLVIRDDAYSFYSYSKGERCRVEFAMILAIQDIINEQNPYGGISFLAADEIFEGLDGLGLKFLMKSIKNIGQDVWLTTHIKDDRITSEAICVEKVNGVSRIRE